VKNEGCLIKIFHYETGEVEDLEKRIQAWLSSQTRIDISWVSSTEAITNDGAGGVVWAYTVTYHYYILDGKGEKKK